MFRRHPQPCTREQWLSLPNRHHHHNTRYSAHPTQAHPRYSPPKDYQYKTMFGTSPHLAHHLQDDLDSSPATVIPYLRAQLPNRLPRFLTRCAYIFSAFHADSLANIKARFNDLSDKFESSVCGDVQCCTVSKRCDGDICLTLHDPGRVQTLQGYMEDWLPIFSSLLCIHEPSYAIIIHVPTSFPRSSLVAPTYSVYNSKPLCI